VKLYLYEDIIPKVAEMLRKKGMDAVSAQETGMLDASDDISSHLRLLKDGQWQP
jgi:predicted nuclease of predicted toxin-antitoxin system